MTSPLPNFAPTFGDHECLELVWDNGQIVTRGRSRRTQKLRSSGHDGSVQDPLSKSILDPYETTYGKQNTRDRLNKNLGDTHVPVRENPGSSALSIPDHKKSVLTKASDKMKGKLKFSDFIKPLNSGLFETATGSNDMMGHENKCNLQLDRKPVEDSVPDEQSVTVGRPGVKVFERSNEQRVASCSMCSCRGSSYPTCSFGGEYEETEGPTNLSDSSEDETEGVTEQVPAITRNTANRKRPAQVHKSSDREQREMINKRMRELQELLPHRDKIDKASTLDEVIEYMKTLQHRIQMMSMGNGFVAPPMMLPWAHYSPVGFGMGMGMHMAPQFLPSPVSTAAAVPIMDDTGHWLRFNDQPLSMPMSCSSFFSTLEGSSAHSIPSPPTPAATFPAQLQKSIFWPYLNDAIHKSKLEMLNNRTLDHLMMPNSSQVQLLAVHLQSSFVEHRTIVTESLSADLIMCSTLVLDLDTG